MWITLNPTALWPPGGQMPTQEKKKQTRHFRTPRHFRRWGGQMSTQEKKQNKHGIFADGGQNAHTRKKQTRHFRRWEGQGAHTRKKNKQMGNTYI